MLTPSKYDSFDNIAISKVFNARLASPFEMLAK